MKGAKFFSAGWRQARMIGVRALRTVQDTSEGSRPVFLVGCIRSGTNMMMEALGRSVEAECYNEDHPAAFHEYRLREFHVIDDLIDRSRAKYVVFKPLMDTHKTPALLGRYPGAFALFPFRHYSDVASSMVVKARRAGEPDHHRRCVRDWVHSGFEQFGGGLSSESERLLEELYSPDISPDSGAALYWYAFTCLYFDLGLDGDTRVLLYEYERTVMSPSEGVRSICDHLGLKYRSRMVSDIHSSSVRKMTRLELDSRVERRCEELWSRLRAEESERAARAGSLSRRARFPLAGR